MFVPTIWRARALDIIQMHTSGHYFHDTSLVEQDVEFLPGSRGTTEEPRQKRPKSAKGDRKKRRTNGHFFAGGGGGGMGLDGRGGGWSNGLVGLGGD